MSAPAPESIVSYWLVPAETGRSFFASTIAELAARFDAPIFEPHLTIYVGRNGSQRPVDIMNRALVDCPPFRLSVRDLQYADEFTKTVFVQFKPTPLLAQLSHTFRSVSAGHDAYAFNPHLSLIYKKMTQRAKIEVITSIQLPFTEVLFDMAQAVIGPRQIQSRQDVESWRVAAVQRLTT